MTTAAEQANPDLAFIKYYELVTENLAVFICFCIIFMIQKQGMKNKRSQKQDNLSNIRFLCKTMRRMQVNNVLLRLGEPAMLMALTTVIRPRRQIQVHHNSLRDVTMY